MSIETALKDLEHAKEFIGGIIATRGYGNEAYSGILRTLKFLEDLKADPDPQVLPRAL